MARWSSTRKAIRLQAGRFERLDVILGGLGRVVKRHRASLHPLEKQGRLGVKKRRKENVRMQQLNAIRLSSVAAGKSDMLNVTITAAPASIAAAENMAVVAHPAG